MARLASPEARLDRLLPRPRVVTATGGTTRLTEHPAVAGPPDWAGIATRLLTSLDAVATAGTPGAVVTGPSGETGPAGVVPGAPAGGVTLVANPSLDPGGYRLLVTEAAVTLAAPDAAGVRHGVQTLLQLLDPAFGLPVAAPDTPRDLACCTIEDAPAYVWRGAHVDVARHFQPLHWLFSFVDALAAHKLNVLHLHLTDDQGWRFEVPAYPRLTEVGSHRPGTRYPSWPDHDGVPRGGFYTQPQLRSLVAYAAQRGITVVPEVDVPGHVRALLAAYPEYGWGEAQPVPTHFDVFGEVLWPDDRAVRLVEDIFTDLLAVFDSPYIHIGGDECPRDQWRGHPDADALAAARGLSGPDQLQRWFTAHLRDWLAARGRRVVGWDEILSDGDVPGAVVMSWRGTRPGREALTRGYDVVMAPTPVLYFDSYQSDSPDEPYGREPVRTWADVVSFDPAEGVADADRTRLLGVQGQAWSEFLPTVEHLEYMVWPRLCALAEVAWHGPADPVAFEPRLRAHLERLDARGISYRPLDGPRPWQVGGTGARKREQW